MSRGKSRFPVISGMADGATVVQLSEEIDLLTAPQVTTCVDDVTCGDHPRVVLDLRAVTFMDCRGLSVLTRARRRVGERGGALSLVVSDQQIMRLLSKTGLLEAFSVHADLRSALAAVAAGRPNPAASA